MSEQCQGAGWDQAWGGTWDPPEHEHAAHSQVSGTPHGARTDEKSMATQRRMASPADGAGATLIVLGILGAVAWAWEFVRTQFVVDDLGSLGVRLDLVARQAPVLLLSGAVAGLGIGLRILAGTQTGASARPVLGRPVGPILLVVAATLAVFLGGAAIDGDRVDSTSDLDTLYDDPPSLDDVVVIAAPTVTTSDGPLEPTHTLEVHSDGCGVFRSGAVGDDLTWVIEDQDGFQVLARNASGETQYRYFRPGTYTVVLETWGDAYYVAASNVVTITC